MTPAPVGSITHWTLPMDAVIRALDPVGRALAPQARRYEGGALLAGPVLAAASLLAVLVGTRLLLGAGAALLAGGFYAFSFSVVNVSWLGNGDHQNLQHLCLVVFAFAALLQIESRPPAWLAPSQPWATRRSDTDSTLMLSASQMARYMGTSA